MSNKRNDNNEDIRKITDEKSFLDTVKEIEERNRQREEEFIQEQLRQEQLRRAEYEKQLRRQKVELMRRRQGVGEEEGILPEKEPQREYTFFEKVSNFIYLNKWWLVLAAFAVLVVGFLTYDYVTKERADMTVLIVCNNYDLSIRTNDIEELFEKYTPDANGDGYVHVDVFYMPTVADENTTNYDLQLYIANQAKFMGEFGAGDSMVVIADVEATNDNAGLDELLTDLEGKIDSDAVDGYKLMLGETRFGELIGCSVLPDDLYLGVREVQTEASYAEEMQKNYETAMAVIAEAARDWAKDSD